MILTAYTLCSACKSLRNIETGTDLILLIILIVVTVIIGSSNTKSNIKSYWCSNYTSWSIFKYWIKFRIIDYVNI